jgi:hypothetical protein
LIPNWRDEEERIMKYKVITTPLLLMALFMAVTPNAVASTTRYVNGVTGSDSNNCLSPTTACETIQHAVSLASSGDSIIVAASTYTENLDISISLKLIGSGARTTIIDGGGVRTVIAIGTGVNVSLSKVTVQHGYGTFGGGISNSGTLTITNSTIRRNRATSQIFLGDGGGIINSGTLRITNSTVSGNSAKRSGGGIFSFCCNTLTVNNSTISGNSAKFAGGIYADTTVTISSSSIAGNSAAYGVGGIVSVAPLNYPVTLQNSIVAGNSGGDCSGTMTSHGYNLSSDNTCDFDGTGDLNNTDPLLGSLQNNGGPTNTMALPSGSPAVDAGNPSGCTDDLGHLLTTDQRSMPRPNTEDTGGCDIGAYERQSD